MMFKPSTISYTCSTTTRTQATLLEMCSAAPGQPAYSLVHRPLFCLYARWGEVLSFLIITRAEKWPDSSKDGMCRNDRFTSVSQLGWWEIYGGYQSTIVYMQLLMYIVPGWSFYIRRWSGCRHVLHKRNNNYYCSVLFTAHLCFSAQAMHIRGSGRRDGPVTGGMPCRPLQDLKTPPAEDACDV